MNFIKVKVRNTRLQIETIEFTKFYKENYNASFESAPAEMARIWTNIGYLYKKFMIFTRYVYIHVSVQAPAFLLINYLELSFDIYPLQLLVYREGILSK